MYKQPISTLTAISAGTIFKNHRQILKHSIVLDRCIRQINTWKEPRLDHVLICWHNLYKKPAKLLFFLPVGRSVILYRKIFVRGREKTNRAEQTQKLLNGIACLTFCVSSITKNPETTFYFLIRKIKRGYCVFWAASISSHSLALSRVSMTVSMMALSVLASLDKTMRISKTLLATSWREREKEQETKPWKLVLKKLVL